MSVKWLAQRLLKRQLKRPKCHHRFHIGFHSSCLCKRTPIVYHFRRIGKFHGYYSMNLSMRCIHGPLFESDLTRDLSVRHRNGTWIHPTYLYSLHLRCNRLDQVMNIRPNLETKKQEKQTKNWLTTNCSIKWNR